MYSIFESLSKLYFLIILIKLRPSTLLLTSGKVYIDQKIREITKSNAAYVVPDLAVVGFAVKDDGGMQSL